MFCFTFVSDHNIDSLMLYLVRLENMYSYQILYVISPVNNRIVTNYHYTNSSSSFFYFILQRAWFTKGQNRPCYKNGLFLDLLLNGVFK